MKQDGGDAVRTESRRSWWAFMIPLTETATAGTESPIVSLAEKTRRPRERKEERKKERREKKRDAFSVSHVDEKPL